MISQHLFNKALNLPKKARDGFINDWISLDPKEGDVLTEPGDYWTFMYVVEEEQLQELDQDLGEKRVFGPGPSWG